MRKHRHSIALTRRRLLIGTAGLGALASTPALAQSGSGMVSAAEFGVTPGSSEDQGAALQKAMETAVAQGQILFLPAGRYVAGNIRIPSNLSMKGVAGASILANPGSSILCGAEGAQNITLDGIGFDGRGAGTGESYSGLVGFRACEAVSLSQCSFAAVDGNLLFFQSSSGRVVHCTLQGATETALFANDSTGLLVSGNEISDCGNGGIRVFRSEPGADGTIVTQNRISNIRSGSGNGQNGNGINAYRADDVVIANNVISDVDFSGVRVNTTRNAMISGNELRNCREVALFSEFGFSGSVISGNIIDQAAQGISMPNLDSGGYLAVCTGNIVRNIWPSSPTNPDTSPVGIFAEADAAITSNLVENVPGLGIGAGWGEYLRNVVIANNVVRKTLYGIGVSVAPGAGKAQITGNLISEVEKTPIGAFKWREPAGDLSKTPDLFDTVTVAGNTVS